MFSILKPYIFSLDPESAHDLAIKALKVNFLPESFYSVKEEGLLETDLFTLSLAYPKIFVPTAQNISSSLLPFKSHT